MNALSFSDFESSGRAVLAFLQRRLGFDLRTFCRIEGKACAKPQTEDHECGVASGTVFLGSYAFCSRMLDGNGPHTASHQEAVPACVVAPVERHNAGVGQPIAVADAGALGRACAIDPVPTAVSIGNEHELVELLGNLLSTILQAELRVAEQTRRWEKLQAEALTDPLTLLHNLRSWDHLLSSEEDRCRRYGHSAVVLVVDLDGLKHVNDTQGHAAGDQLIVRAGLALRKAARSLDVVARFGGDEFGILSAECDEVGGKALLTRVRAALAAANIEASIGLSMRDSARGLRDACRTADRRMYQEKRRKNSFPVTQADCRAASIPVMGDPRSGSGEARMRRSVEVEF